MNLRNLIIRFRQYWLQDASFILLLLMLVFTIFFIPALIDSDFISVRTFGFMLLTLFFVGIWSAEKPWLLVASVALFSMHLILRIIRFSDLPYAFKWLEEIVSSLNVLIFLIINFTLLMRPGFFKFERVIGAVNIYLLFALLGAFLFALIQNFTGASILGNVHLKNDDSDFVHYIYYSLVCLTTVGFGDIFPANQMARMLSVFLSALGILYPAVIIARLVSLIEKPERKKET